MTEDMDAEGLLGQHRVPSTDQSTAPQRTSEVEEERERSSPMVAAEGKITSSERWAKRLQVARGVLSWAGEHARPVSERLRDGAAMTGHYVGQGVMAGGTAIGVGIAGVGLLTIGGPVGATVAVAGGVIGAAGLAGGWVTQKVGQGVGMGIGFAGVITERSIQASEAVLSGVHAVLTKTQAEFLLGQEGAAVFDHVLEIHRDVKGGLEDCSNSQLVSGLVAYACLQRACGAPYSSAHYNPALDSPSPLLPSDEVHELVRHALIAGQTYGAAHNALLGSKGSAGDILKGNEASLVRHLALERGDILRARWETEGTHNPGYLLLNDRKRRTLVLAVRGTFHALDALTDLRCTAGSVRVACGEEGEREEAVHLGMWESAVRMDADLSEHVAAALAPGGPCHGFSLVLTGHSLGAAVATLLSLRWRRTYPQLRCYSFAPPCGVSLRLAGYCTPFVTSVVLSNDAVCRWSFGSTKDALMASAALAREKGAVEKCLSAAFLGMKGEGDANGAAATADREDAEDPLQSPPRVPEGVGEGHGEGGSRRSGLLRRPERVWGEAMFKSLDAVMDHDKLYPAGRVIWLVPNKSGDKRAVPITAHVVEPATFERLVLCRSMISDHIIGNYERALASLLPPKDQAGVAEAVESIASLGMPPEEGAPQWKSSVW